MISINKSSCIFATIISFMLIILTLSCSEHERILSKRNDVQENYLQLSSYQSFDCLSTEDIYTLSLAIKRFGIYIDGNDLKYRAESAQQINIDPELYTIIEGFINKEQIKTRSYDNPSDCVAQSLSLWGGASYETINAYIISEFGNDGVPADKIFDVIRHFFPKAQPHYLDTNDIDFSTSIMTTVGVMYTENQNSLHRVNIDYIDSLGYVTYFDKQQGSIGYNNATDYSVFYTKE